MLKDVLKIIGMSIFAILYYSTIVWTFVALHLPTTINIDTSTFLGCILLVLCGISLFLLNVIVLCPPFIPFYVFAIRKMS